MTASNPTNHGNVKVPGADDSIAIIEYLQESAGSVPIERLAVATGLPRPLLKYRLETLRSAGQITVQTGLEDVYIDVVDDSPPIRTDGGERKKEISLQISPAEAFEILSNDRRRRMIRALAAWSAPGEEKYFTIGGLVNSFYGSATGISGATIGGLSDAARHASYVSLAQTHCKRLDEAGVIQYYERVKKVQPMNDVHALAALLDAVEAASEDSKRLYIE